MNKFLILVTGAVLSLPAAGQTLAKAQFVDRDGEDMGQAALIDPAGEGFDFDIAPGSYKPTYESFAELYRCPDWFRDVKFGIYMHWGLGSVAGFVGHYGRDMYWSAEPDSAQRANKLSGYRPACLKTHEYHVKNFGHPSKFGYKDFIPLWKPDKFDPDSLVSLYVEAGAQFVGVMAVHHDNFDLYESTYQPWNSVKMGPHLDVVGAWRDAVRRRGLRFAISSHLSNYFHEHAFYQGPECDATGPMAGVPYDYCDTAYNGLYGDRVQGRMMRRQPDFAINWYRRTKELIDKYRPDLLYFDGPLPCGVFGRNIAAHYYNLATDSTGATPVVMTIKRKHDGIILDRESAGVDDIQADPYLTDSSINPGWFYLGQRMNTGKGAGDAGMDGGVVGDTRGKDRLRLNAAQIVDNLCDIVSKNGTMMLNVGLRADGSLPETFADELRKIGAWLRVNGEAIYGTRPYKVYGEGPFRPSALKGKYNDHQFNFTDKDIRFTTRDGALYVISMEWPGDGATLHVKTLTETMLPGIASVTDLASGNRLEWTQDADGLHITLPATAPSPYATVYKITTD